VLKIKIEMESKDYWNSGYGLEKRTLDFSKNVRSFCRKLPKDIMYRTDIEQVIKSFGSVGANYIEANESLSKKRFSVKS
jgi:four helix bundle protein